MNTESSLRRAIRLAIGSAVALASALPMASAIAQDTDEEILVIGSRIPRSSDFQSPSPVVSVDRDSIEKSGYSNLEQLMQRIPANGNGAFSTRGNNQDSTANGAASISLRGLGADATLVLINGRRAAVSPFAESVTTNFVDINAIPVAAIERVEVLKDGASAVYGSDAVAGVINIVLRNNFEGLELAGGWGNTTEGDYEETTGSAIWGIGGDNGNVTLIFDYFKNTTLGNAERGSFGSANQSSRGGQDFRSSRGYPGRFLVDDGVNPPALRIDPGCPADRAFPPTCVFDFGPFNLLVPEAERTGLMMLGHLDVGAGVQLFSEIAIQHNNSIAQGAPTPLDDTALMTVPVNHPNNPYDDAVGVIGINRYRTVDAGARQWDISTDNLRGVFGLRGEVGNWNWEVAGQRARSESEQSGDKSMGWVRTDFLQQQIDLGLYNPFGGVQNPADVIDAITTNLVRRGSADLTMVDASVSGEIFKIADRPILMAVGAEWRHESVEDVPDDQFQRGLIFGTESVSAKADRKNKAAYVEFSVPVIEGLDLELAARYDDYDDFGDTTNPKIAVRYAPIDMLAFRASWGTGFRAPSLAQIGLGPSQESQFFVDEAGCAVNPAYCVNTDYLIVFSGNPNLQPEESETLNIGVAFQPTEAMEFTVDYWDITQKDKIDEVPFGFLLDNFCQTQISTVCVRSAPIGNEPLGQLQQVNSGFINIGEQSATGIDLGGYFRMDLGGNALTFGLNYSRLLNFEKVELNSAGDGFVTRDLTGEYEYPEDRATLSADFGNDAWGVYTNLSYIGPFQDMPDVDFDGVLDFDSNDTRDVGSFTTLNLQFRYTGIENMRFMFSVDNAFDEKPPFAVGDGDTDLYGYVQSQHSPRGRFWNAKATFDF